MVATVAQLVPEELLLGGQVGAGELGRFGDHRRELVVERVAVLAEDARLLRVVGGEVDLALLRDAEEPEHRHHTRVGADVDHATGGQHGCRLDGVDAERLLEPERTQLEGQPHAATVLVRNVDDHALADLADGLHGQPELVTALAGEITEHLAGLAAGVGAENQAGRVVEDQRERLVVQTRLHDDRVLLPLVVDREVEHPERAVGGHDRADAATLDGEVPPLAVLGDGDDLGLRQHAVLDDGQELADLLARHVVARGDVVDVDRGNLSAHRSTSAFCGRLCRGSGRGVGAVTAHLRECSGVQSDRQSILGAVDHGRPNQRATFRACQVGNFREATECLPAALGRRGKDAVEIQPLQRAGAILLVQDQMGGVLRAEQVQELRSPSATRILVPFRRVSDWFYWHNHRPLVSVLPSCKSHA